MLRPVYEYDIQTIKEELFKASKDPFYKFYFVNGIFLDDVEASDESNSYDRISYDEYGEILGYFSAYKNMFTDTIEGTSFIKFIKNDISDNDFEEYLEGLFQHRKVIIKSIKENPANKRYMELCKKYNGRVVGILKEHWKSLGGELHDVIFYEYLKKGIDKN